MLGAGIADAEGFKEVLGKVFEAREGKKLEDTYIFNDDFTFEDSLLDGWVTPELLADSISKMAEQFRGLTDEQIRETGYSKKQVEAMLELDDGIKKGTVDIEKFADKMGTLSGREKIIEGLGNALKFVWGLLKPIGDAFRQIFPPVTSDMLSDLIDKFQTFARTLEVSEDTAKKIRKVFVGLFFVVDVIKDIFVAVGEGVANAIADLSEFGGGFLDTAADIGDFLYNLAEVIKQSEVFRAVTSLVGNVLYTAGYALIVIGSAIKDFALYLAEAVTGGKGFADTVDGIAGFLGKVEGVLKSVIY
jgi:hypothetical protein